MKKKEAVLKYLPLTEAEKSAFWPIYDNYNEAVRYFEMEYIQILSDILNGRSAMSNEKIEKLSSQLLKNDCLLAQVRKTYYRKFKRVLSAGLASDFMQLDNMMRSMLRLELQKDSPPMVVSQLAIYKTSENYE
jgi:hypothetical protein